MFLANSFSPALAGCSFQLIETLYGCGCFAPGLGAAHRREVGIRALVEDVVSSGGAIVDALEKLREDGLSPIAALCVIDRQTAGKEALAAAGLPLKSLFTFAQVERAFDCGERSWEMRSTPRGQSDWIDERMARRPARGTRRASRCAAAPDRNARRPYCHRQPLAF